MRARQTWRSRWSIARQREHRLEGVEGTCPDVAENHAKGRKPRDWKARAERAVSAALMNFIEKSAITTGAVDHGKTLLDDLATNDHWAKLG